MSNAKIFITLLVGFVAVAVLLSCCSQVDASGAQKFEKGVMTGYMLAKKLREQHVQFVPIMT